MPECITIDKVNQTKQGRMALFSDEQFLFSVDTETYFAEHLQVGMSFTPDELEELWNKTQLRKAKDKALQYLSLRDYASGELYNKLCLKFDEHASAAAVAAMNELGLIDDAAFARHRVKYLMARNKSKSQVRRHLAEKGVSRELIQDVLDEFYQAAGDEMSPEITTALHLIEKSYGRKLLSGKRENVLAALARRGFSLSDSREAIEVWQSRQDELE